MTTATIAATTVDISRLRLSTYDPRTDPDDAAQKELNDSVAHDGILQPLLVRPVKARGKKNLEVIAGGRRLRAALANKLDQVPVTIVEVDDETAKRLAIVENLQRDDLSPLALARAIRDMRERQKMTAREVAELLGKDPREVARLERLAYLPDAAIALFEADKLPLAAAYYLGRVEDEKVVAGVLKKLKNVYGTPSFSQVRGFVDNAAQPIASFQFDAEEVGLLDEGPGVAACTACPFNTKTEDGGLLWPETASKALCTRPSCAKAKETATYKRAATIEKEHGNRVAPKSLYGRGTNHNKRPGKNLWGDIDRSSKWIELRGKCDDVEGSEDKTWNKMIGSKPDGFAIAIVGKARHKVIERAKARELLKAAGHKVKKAPAASASGSTGSPSGPSKKDIARSQRREDRENVWENKFKPALRDWAASYPEAEVRWGILRAIVIDSTRHEGKNSDWMKLHAPGVAPSDLLEHVHAMPEDKLLGALLDAFTGQVYQVVGWSDGKFAPFVLSLAQTTGFVLNDAEKQVVQEREEAERAATKKKAPRKKAKTRKKATKKS